MINRPFLSHRASAIVLAIASGCHAAHPGTAHAPEQALTLTGHASADAYCRDGADASRNFGTATALRANAGEPGANALIYVRVDLSTVSTRVISARLRMYGAYAAPLGSAYVALHGVADPFWQENDLTWNTRPALQPELGRVRVMGGAQTVYEWDATAFVAAQLAAGQRSVSFALRSTQSTASGVSFASRESGTHAPTLELDVEAPESAAEAGAPDGAPVAEDASVDGSFDLDAGTDAGASGEEMAETEPHPLYPPLDLRTLPLHGSQAFSYRAPQLPGAVRNVTVASRAALERECDTVTGRVAIDVAADLLGQGPIFLRGTDCDLTLRPDVRIATLMLEPSVRRLRVRGGQIGSVSTRGPGITDVVFDGVVFNTGLLAPSARPSMIFTLRDLRRLAIVRSLGRAAPTVSVTNGSNIDGGVFYVERVHDVLIAGSNFACADTANANGWFARIESGGNWLLVDTMVKVYFHRMIRLSDLVGGAGLQFDYLVVRGGAFMHARRDSTVDQMSAGGASDHVYLEDVTFYVDEPTTNRVFFGAQFSSRQTTRLWQATGLRWHARSSAVVSDAVLAGLERMARPGEFLRYRLGAPTYAYHPGGVPFPAWQQVAAFADSNPEDLPQR
jgi:hypothetical protein